jgi:hypothetical protein
VLDSVTNVPYGYEHDVESAWRAPNAANGVISVSVLNNSVPFRVVAPDFGLGPAKGVTFVAQLNISLGGCGCAQPAAAPGGCARPAAAPGRRLRPAGGSDDHRRIPT